MQSLSIESKQESALVCYEVYGIVTILFAMVAIGLAGRGFPVPAAVGGLPAVFSILRIVQMVPLQ